MSETTQVDTESGRRHKSNFIFTMLAGSWARRTIVGIVLAGLVVAPFVIRAAILANVPEIDEPFDVREFAANEIPADQDATLDYRRATSELKKLNQMQQSASLEIAEAYGKNADKLECDFDDHLKSLMDERRELLLNWRQGTDKPRFQVITIEDATSIGDLESFEEREFARLAAVEALLCLNEGRIEEAYKWSRATFRFGGHISTKALYIKAALSYAIHSTSCKSLIRWAQHPSVTSATLKQALQEIRADDSLYDLSSNQLKAEYLLTRRTLLSLQSQMYSGDVDSNALRRIVSMGMWVFGKPELSVRLLRQVLVNQIQQADMPLYERQYAGQPGKQFLFNTDSTGLKIRGQMTHTAIQKALPTEPLVEMLGPAQETLSKTFLRRKARQCVLEISLAAQAYRRDHGEFPESLELLVPDYLAEVPRDPNNSVTAPLLYRRDAATDATVWSVNGGQTFDKENKVIVGFRLQ